MRKTSFVLAVCLVIVFSVFALASIEDTDTSSSKTSSVDASSQTSSESSSVGSESGESGETAESSEPVTESSEPAAESSEPAAESSEPVAESSEPAAESSEPPAESSEPETENSESDNEIKANLGDFYVDVVETRFAKSYDGDGYVVIVTYTFTNVSHSDPIQFALAVSHHAYQNGIEVGVVRCEEGVKYESDNIYRNIKIGATVEFDISYEIIDLEAPLELNLTKLISFDDEALVGNIDVPVLYEEYMSNQKPEIDENKEWVIPALDYEKDVIALGGGKYDEGGEFGKHIYRLPKIDGDTDAIKAFNEKIYNTYINGYNLLINDQEEDWIMQVDYEYKINDGVVLIVVNVFTGVQFSEGSEYSDAYYFDLNADTELTHA